MRYLALPVALLFSALAPAQRPATPVTASNPNTAAEITPLANPDPRIAEFTGQQRAGTTVRNVGAVELSPDGKQIAWLLAPAGAAGAGGRRGGGGAELRISPASAPNAADPVIASAEGCVGTGAPRWSPDGSSLAFVSDCGPDRQPQIVVRNSSGAVRQLTHITGALTSPAWSPDGASIGFLYVENASRAAGALAAMKMPSGVVGEDGVEVQWVAAADAKSGALTVLTPKTLHAYEFDWAPDSKHVAFVAANPPGENTWWIAKMYVATVGMPDSSKAILDPVTVGGSLHGLQIAVPRYSPNGKNIAFIGGLMSDQGSTGGDIYLMNADGTGLQDLTTGRKSSPVYVTWADDDHILFSEDQPGKSHLGLLGTNGKETLPGWTEAQSIGSGRASASFSFSPTTHTVAFVSAGPDHAAEVYTGDPRGIHAITHINDNAKSTEAKTVSLEWKSDVYNVQGWLTLPENYNPGKKYPLIVSVHGGPSAEVGPFFGGGAGALWAHLGYFFLQPNPRGSFGQGEAFTQANRKDFGYGDLRDIVKGVDASEAKYSIDDKRVGLTGWSYGGFMSMFGITQTHRFRAAVAGAGISNWQSYYGENSIDQWMVPFFGATVYENPAVYAKSSAINFVKNVTTPTLIIVGDRDGECPAPQSYELWHALRAQGVKTQLVVYPNEGHGFTSPLHNADRTARTIAWFEENMQ